MEPNGYHPQQAAAVDPTPLLLSASGDHAVYWLGSDKPAAFRCNAYLLVSGDDALLVDPGGVDMFEEVYDRVVSLVPTQRVRGMILSHQDPDVAASMPLWLRANAKMLVIASPRVHVLLGSYFQGNYARYDSDKGGSFCLAPGRELRFISAPFLHFPDAIVTYDAVSGSLFSGDVWASLDVECALVVEDFARHRPRLDLFNKDYMASNRATRGFLARLAGLAVAAILPQHGAIIPEKFVPHAIQYLADLECGLDLLYPDGQYGPAAPLAEGEASLFRAEEAQPDLERKGLEPCPTADPQRYVAVLGEGLSQAMRLVQMRDRALRALRRAQEKLRESEARLAEAQAIAHLGYWEWDIRGGVVHWSPETYHIFGVQPQEFEPGYEAFLATVHAEDRERVRTAVHRALAEDAPYDVIFRIVRPTGEERTVQARGRITRNRDGAPVRMLGTVQDITSLARVEGELLRRNRLIEAIQRMQATFIGSGDSLLMSRRLLDDLLALTGSEHGFVGEVHTDPDGRPYLIAHAISNLAWNELTDQLYQQAMEKGLEFHQLDNLLGHAVATGEPVIANDPARHPASKGLPEGHPQIRCYLGIPVYYGERIVGCIGLANRPAGYDRAVLDYLGPLVLAYGQAIVAAQDQRARRRAEEILVEQAKLDGLLGIPNRRHFDEYLAAQIKSCDRQDAPLAVIMMDVDEFKRFNDRYGHRKGDACLKEVAAAIQAALRRPLDLVGRYGGEEFCCVLPETDEQGAWTVARRVQKELAARHIPHVASSGPPVVTLSMGIAVRAPRSALSAEELIDLADRRLYQAKTGGRNRIVG